MIEEKDHVMDSELAKNLKKWMHSTLEMEPRNGKRGEFINEFGGVETVIKLLNVDPDQGLGDEDKNRRIEL